jgi:hypothetical protein
MPILGGGLLRDGGQQKRTLRARLLLFDPPVPAADLSRIMNQLKRLLLIRLGRFASVQPHASFSLTAIRHDNQVVARADAVDVRCYRFKNRKWAGHGCSPPTARRKDGRWSEGRGWLAASTAPMRSVSVQGTRQGAHPPSGGFVPERWAASNRNGGRDQFVTAGDFKSVCLGDVIGIRSRRHPVVLSGSTSYTDRGTPGFPSEPFGSPALSRPG